MTDLEETTSFVLAHGVDVRFRARLESTEVRLSWYPVSGQPLHSAVTWKDGGPPLGFELLRALDGMRAELDKDGRPHYIDEEEVKRRMRRCLVG